MKAPRHSNGTSDPIKYTCTCPAGTTSTPGSVLLFYRYWGAPPALSSQHQDQTSDVEALAAWHRNLTDKHLLGGKIRIAREGFNVTVGGTHAEIEEYMKACASHWSFSGLGLESEVARIQFFKPTDGCACVFGGAASVRVTAEITPMGVEGYVPADWESVEVLSPEEFHRRCHEEENLLLDVRNHYESRIGYFVDPRTGMPAVRPAIRRFSQWPRYVRRHLGKVNDGGEGGVGVGRRQIMTYCTGGIRCEKAVRWMQENGDGLEKGERICTLRGGIAAYLAWMEDEIKEGRKTVDESLFRGRNYVFDARGSTGLSTEVEPVARCHVCGTLEDNLIKCGSQKCHLVLVVCAACEKQDPRCCQSCSDLDEDEMGKASNTYGPRPVCACEQEREFKLWGNEQVDKPKTQGWKTAKRKMAASSDHIDVWIQTID